MNYCSNCKGENPPHALHCQHCGSNLQEMSAQMACGACGRDNRPVALYCRHCGHSLTDLPGNVGSNSPTTNKSGRLSRTLKWVGLGCGGFIALFIILIIVASICGTPDDTNNPQSQSTANSDHSTTPKPDPTPASTRTRPHPTITPFPTPTATPVPTATPTPTPIQMELADLLDEYDQNKVRANSRLRYRENGNIPITTSGYVSNVEELYFDLTYGQEQYSFQELHCYYAATETALEITKGQLVTVTGKVRGTDGFSNDVYMFACEIDGIRFVKKPMVSAQTLRNNVVQVYCLSSSIFSSGYKGTGVITDAENGIVLTVHHVVADENKCKEIEVKLPGVESRVPATVVRHCASIDRARLRIPAQDLTATLQPIYRAPAPAQPDQEIFFWGYGPGELRMETGLVMDVFGKDIITDAYAVPGDSGSPVFDENGHLLGTMSRSNRSDRAVFTGEEC